MNAPKVYLAGPEVFLADGRAIIARKQALLAEYGFAPSARQGEFRTWSDRSAHEVGIEISRHNEVLIEEADLLIANLTPFRSVSADPGTVFELGYMCALGRPVLGYTNDVRDYRERIAALPEMAPLAVTDGKLRARDASMVEDHGFADNLMIEGAILRANGIVARHTPAPDAIWTDLTGLAACLEHARAHGLARG